MQSALLSVTSGVPQGSVFGPLIFTSMTTYLSVVIFLIFQMTFTYLCADDAKLFSISDNCVELQKHFNLVESFSSTHQLFLAQTKCQHLAIKCKDSINNEYFIGDNQILWSATVKDLGVLISSNLKWSCHILQIVSSAFTSSYCILKSFSTKNIWTLLKTYITFVRPKFEYQHNI